jgi:hypothetical protein
MIRASINKARSVAAYAVVTAAVAFAATGADAAVVIDGTITPGEWAGATNAIIGNGGGTASFFADTNFIYGAFDITGWTSAMGAASQGNLLGFGVWAKNNGAVGGDGVEFQQSTTTAAWGGGTSGTMNGLLSAFRLDTVIQGSIPGTLEAMDSFATGHRVWEVKMPISTMTIVDNKVWVVGGINYAGQTHWYPDTFFPGFNGYIEVPVSAAVPLPAAAPFLLTALGGLGLFGWRRKRNVGRAA